jgi:phage shock protein E
MRQYIWTVAAAVAVIAVLKVIAKSPPQQKATVQEKIKQGALVLDVRTAAEFAGGHHPSARNIPVQELQARLKEVGNTSQAIVVYCQSGSRSAMAARILRDAGFADVTNAGRLQDMPQ